MCVAMFCHLSEQYYYGELLYSISRNTSDNGVTNNKFCRFFSHFKDRYRYGDGAMWYCFGTRLVELDATTNSLTYHNILLLIILFIIMAAAKLRFLFVVQHLPVAFRMIAAREFVVLLAWWWRANFAYKYCRHTVPVR